MNLIIIGNGVLGLSIALEYSALHPKASIGIVGPLNRSGGATVAAGAMLGCFGEVTRMTLASEPSRTLLDLAVEGSKQWDSWLESINQCVSAQERVTIQPGTFVILNTETASHEGNNYKAIIEALRRYAEPFEEVDPECIPGFQPVDNCRPLRALYLPKEGSIRPEHLLNAMTSVLKQRGVVFFDDKVIDIVASSHAVQELITEQGLRLKAQQMVLSAGAYSQYLIDKLPDLAWRIPRVFSGHGTALMLNNVENSLLVTSVIRSPNRAGACGIHLVPCDKDSNHLYLGASNSLMPSPGTEPKVRHIFYLLKQLTEQLNFNFHKAGIIKYISGNRPVSLDSFPLIGPTSMDNLWLATGTYRIGIELAPIIAHFVARRLLNEPVVQNLQSQFNVFRAERPLIPLLNKEQSKQEFVRQYFGGGYEHGWILPKVGWESMIMDAMRDRANTVYEMLGIEIGLHPDIMIMLETNRQLIPMVKAVIEQNQQAFSKENLLIS